VELYARVRRAVAREFGLARKTVGKKLEYALPRGYQRQKPIKQPKLGPLQGVIDAILAGDKAKPVKQRHTAKRIFERLRAEYEYTGGYMIVKVYVRTSKISSREMFVPLSHSPGEALADFGGAMPQSSRIASSHNCMVRSSLFGTPSCQRNSVAYRY